MQSVFDLKIGYSEHFADIMGKQFRGDCTVHLLCMAGEGVFTFNGKRYVLHERLRRYLAYAFDRGDGRQRGFEGGNGVISNLKVYHPF